MPEQFSMFKLHYSGRFDTIDPNVADFYDLFSPVNIIVIYLSSQKRLYSWIGSQASQTLKNYITHFREHFGNAYPELRVLRYITCDPLEEPWDFFEGTGISKQQLHEKIEYYEKKLLPKLSEIKDLQSKADKHFEAKEYPEAIDVGKQILELAQEIDDKPLKTAQEEFISECELRERTKQILAEIDEETKIINQDIHNTKTDEDIVNLHDKVEQFKNKFTELIDFTTLPPVELLLEKEADIWKEYEARNRKKLLLDKLKVDINELRIKGKETLGKGELRDAHGIFTQIIEKITEVKVKLSG